LYVIRRLAIPRGAFDGMMALIWPGLTKTGIAVSVVVPCVIETETALRVVDSGNDNGGEVAGPRFAPKIENWAPCAMPPPGKAGGI